MKRSIVDVVKEFVELSRAGAQWKGKCPFENNNKPTMRVSPESNVFYCSNCRRGGDDIVFIANLKGLSPVDAQKYLEENYVI